jgi:thiol-disulfide isomerase/thioredoxin
MIELNLENFTEKTAEGWHMIKIYRTDCEACTMIQEEYESRAKELDGKFNFSAFELTKENYEEAKKLIDVEGVPAFVLFYNGQMAAKVIGYVPPKEILLDIKNKIIENFK